MRSVTVKMPVSSVAVLAADAGISVMMPSSSVEIVATDSAINVEIPDRSVSVLCDDDLASTFTTPTLVSWSANAVDLEAAGCRVYFSAVTAGSPCRVRFHLFDTETTQKLFSSPEQNTPHSTIHFITEAYLRGQTYDLFWSWSSGNESVFHELVLADAVYIPASGGGDQLSES